MKTLIKTLALVTIGVAVGRVSKKKTIDVNRLNKNLGFLNSTTNRYSRS